jgi:short-subunit dehydrogenase involved in D-alanine esterification of teichoic acids
MKTSGNTVVITGGAGGIGLALATALLAQKNDVIVLSRTEDSLARAKERVPGIHTAVCDVTDEASIRATFDRLAAEHRGLNVLVNAAGVSRACQFAEDAGAIELARAEIATNLLGTVMATKIALDHFMKKDAAAIVTISSGIAIAPHRGEPTHSATKAALHAFCRCLRAQLEGGPVKVFEVMPPLVQTALTEKVRGKKIRPEDVAAAIVKGMRRDNYEIKVGIVKALGFLVRISPSLAESIVTGSAHTPALPPKSAH